MMQLTKLISIISFLFFSFCSVGQTDREKQKFFGNVLHVKESKYEVYLDESGKLQSGYQLTWTQYKFDSLGNLMHWGDFYLGGILSWGRYFIYKDGYLSEVIDYQPQTNSVYATDWELLSAPLEYYRMSSVAYTWKEGRQVSWVKTDAENNIVFTWINEYDKQGKKLKSYSQGRNGKTDRTYLYTYDKKGNCIHESWQDSLNTVYQTTQNSFNKSGQIVESRKFNADGSLQKKWINKYDSKGRFKVIEHYHEETVMDSKTVYEYDRYGNDSLQQIFNGRDSLIGTWSYKYIYDKQRNWVLKTRFYNQAPYDRVERIITYYP